MRKLLAIGLVCQAVSGVIYAQRNNQVSNSKDHFPYSFSNFVWWSDGDLRAELKRRIPNLGDELTRDSQSEAKIRTVLTVLLKEKGIRAQVQSIEPSETIFAGGRVPEAPPPAIVFGILSPPEIVIEKLVLEDPPVDAVGLLNEAVFNMEGKPYAETNFWMGQEQIKQNLQKVGYLDSTVLLKAGLPKKESDERYSVPLSAAITSGPKYHVGSIKADGGPLFQGKDLSQYFSSKTGDVATLYTFARLIGALRSFYWHAGYPDVDFEDSQMLDKEHALANYQLKVIPGPIYYLRSVRIENLSPDQQEQALKMLGIKTGDVYDPLAVANLSRRLSETESPLKGYGVSFSPKEDKENHVVDLTLSFYKQ